MEVEDSSAAVTEREAKQMGQEKQLRVHLKVSYELPGLVGGMGEAYRFPSVLTVELGTSNKQFGQK